VTGNEIKTLLIVVEGRVQGVGYREFVRRAALRLQLSGWVRNRRDGAVEARVSGEALDLDALVDAMRAGPSMANVRALNAVEDGDPPESGGFVVASSA
jgi:acylphosphatase